MDEFKELCEELEQHREQMFSTIFRTIQDAASLFDTELSKSLQAIASIYDDKYQSFENEQTELKGDEFWDWIERKYLQNYEDKNFSFKFLKSYDELKRCFSPSYDDEAYQNFLLLTDYIGKQPLDFDQQLYFLSGSFRFYRQLGTKDGKNIDLNKDVARILRIDREVAFIREDIYSAIATRKKTAEHAKRTTKINVANELKNSEPFTNKSNKYHATFVQIAREYNGKKIKFGKFIETVAPRIEISGTGLRNHLKGIGVDQKNFEEWLATL